jgi:hypothetical protein
MMVAKVFYLCNRFYVFYGSKTAFVGEYTDTRLQNDHIFICVFIKVSFLHK